MRFWSILILAMCGLIQCLKSRVIGGKPGTLYEDIFVSAVKGSNWEKLYKQHTDESSFIGYKKGHRTKIFLRVSTPFSNIFAPHIQNLETYFSNLVYFDFSYVCAMNS